MINILEIRNLEKSFTNFSLKDITFALPKGYIMGLVGNNGSGKTTLIGLILNMLKRDAGEILFNGIDILANEKQIKNTIGVVFDSHCLCEDWTALESEKAISPFYDTWDRSKYRSLLSKFKLPENKAIKDFSKGMQMKAMLSIALSHDSKLLLLDEPTSGLDIKSRRELLSILQEYILDGERSVLFSTHIASDLDKIADYITLLDNGKLIYSGSKNELVDSFYRITGDKTAISAIQKQTIIGYREFLTGFEGLIFVGDRLKFANATVEPVELEEVILNYSEEMTVSEQYN